MHNTIRGSGPSWNCEGRFQVSGMMSAGTIANNKFDLIYFWRNLALATCALSILPAPPTPPPPLYCLQCSANFLRLRPDILPANFILTPRALSPFLTSANCQ